MFSPKEFFSRQTLLRTKAALSRLFLKYPAVEIFFVLALLVPTLFVVVVALTHSASLLAVECGPLTHQLLLPGLMLLFAAAVPIVRTPISALICLLGLFATASLVYLLAGAEYFANVSFIVSIGGVAIIFLFVIMLIDPRGLIASEKPVYFDTLYTLAAMLGGALFFRLTRNVQAGLDSYFSSDTFSIPSEQDLFRAHMETDILLFRTLFGDDWALFALITLILLLSMLAAIIIATLSSEEGKEKTKVTPPDEPFKRVRKTELPTACTSPAAPPTRLIAFRWQPRPASPGVCEYRPWDFYATSSL